MNTPGILIDGTPNPTAFMLDRQHALINLPVQGKVRQYSFVRVMDGPSGQVFIYRDKAAKLNDKLFDQLAADEADKYLNPEKYAKLQGGALTAAEKQLAAYKEKYGPLTKE